MLPSMSCNPLQLVLENKLSGTFSACCFTLKGDCSHAVPTSLAQMHLRLTFIACSSSVLVHALCLRLSPCALPDLCMFHSHNLRSLTQIPLVLHSIVVWSRAASQLECEDQVQISRPSKSEPGVHIQANWQPCSRPLSSGVQEWHQLQ